MDNPLGNHNGKVHGREYFQCAPFHGLFVRTHRVTRMPDSALGQSASSSRASTPLPTLHQRPHSVTSSSSGGAGGQRSYGVQSPAASSVATDSSYFYDEDYRQNRLPTIASLGQKIDEIEASSSGPRSRSNSSLIATPPPPPPVGILKKSSSYRYTPAEPRSRSETRQNNERQTLSEDAGSDPRVPVFNFRPRRAKLNQLQRDFQATRDASGILSDLSNRTGSAGGVVDLGSEPPQIGDRVWVRSERGDISGVLRFMGETNFATGEWAGIELDRAEGKNDGSVLGYRYFCCPQNYGLFVPATRVRKHESSPGFKAMRSTILSPPPLKSTVSGGGYDTNSYNGGSNDSRSMTPSSYYSSDKTTPSPATDLRRHYSSSCSNITSPTEDNTDELVNCLAEFFDISHKIETPKFDDRDIEFQIKRSLQRNNFSKNSSAGTANGSEDGTRPKPRSVKYTFSTSKYDGNPIARRTVEYD